jgi:hypothetical protein
MIAQMDVISRCPEQIDRIYERSMRMQALVMLPGILKILFQALFYMKQKCFEIFMEETYLTIDVTPKLPPWPDRSTT